MRRSTALPHPVVVSMRLPYPPYLWKVVRQSALLWILVRLMYSVLLFLATWDLTAALRPNRITHVFLIAVVAFLVWWDRKRSHELLLPANLGASSGWFWTASLLTATGLELTTQLLLAVL
jgi:hypothetical protein